MFIVGSQHKTRADRLQQSIDLLPDRNTNLAAANADLRRQMARLETLAWHEQQKTRRTPCPLGRVRVIYLVRGRLNAPARWATSCGPSGRS